MTKIREGVTAYCPEADLAGALEAALRTFRRDSGEVRWTMRVPIGGATASREVVASVRYRPRENGRASVELRFGPEDSALYPHFDGQLTARALDPWNAEIAIEGSYEAPLGVVGAAFDAAVGARLARASIRRLVRDLADEVETAGMFEQAAD